MPETTERKPFVLTFRPPIYDGRYDGPDYHHPFWPSVSRGKVFCAVCGLDIHGYFFDGTKDDHPNGDPHPRGAGGWFRTQVTATDNYLTCPDCYSYRVALTIDPGAYGTGPGRSWRMGDPGGRQVAECMGCGRRTAH